MAVAYDDALKWKVWLADGTTRDSSRDRWEDVPDGVLVLRWWGPKGNGINWGDGIYGHPSTHKQAAIVPDDVFNFALEDARGCNNPPA